MTLDSNYNGTSRACTRQILVASDVKQIKLCEISGKKVVKIVVQNISVVTGGAI